MSRELICISCPVGCRLTANIDKKGNVSITGNKCMRGEVYGREEIHSPKRVVTAVVRTDSQLLPYVPVRTAGPLPKEMVTELLNTLYGMQAVLPLKRGDVLIDNYAGSGVNVVITREVEH